MGEDFIERRKKGGAEKEGAISYIVGRIFGSEEGRHLDKKNFVTTPQTMSYDEFRNKLNRVSSEEGRSLLPQLEIVRVNNQLREISKYFEEQQAAGAYNVGTDGNITLPAEDYNLLMDAHDYISRETQRDATYMQESAYAANRGVSRVMSAQLDQARERNEHDNIVLDAFVPDPNVIRDPTAGRQRTAA